MNASRPTFYVLRPILTFLLLLLLPALALAQSGGGYDLSWSTVDGGGATFSAGRGYSLGGTRRPGGCGGAHRRGLHPGRRLLGRRGDAAPGLPAAGAEELLTSPLPSPRGRGEGAGGGARATAPPVAWS
ncbi:MAG: hypothetical protein ACUVS6_08935 [Anaerolineae bacterium]